MIEMQSSMRGFLLTRDTVFLEEFNGGLTNVPPLIAEQRNLVINNPEELLILDAIANLHSEWITYANTLIEAKKGALSESFLPEYENLFEERLKKQAGKKINDRISQKFSDLDRIEYRLREVHRSNLATSIQRTHTFSFLLSFLTILFGIVSTIYIIKLISNRIKTMVTLADSIAKGEFTTINDTSKDELTSLSTSLNIMSESLRKNISELEKRNAELDKFAYVVSHDLKAPVRGIYNAIMWIEEDLGTELSPEMKKYLSIIPQRTRRMEDLINGLLDYARLRKKVRTERTDTQQLINEIVDEIVPPGFKVETQHLPVLNTEKLKLQQVFTNLISNSVKYAQSEDGHITISSKELSQHYEFSVKDNGIGIEPAYHDKIFEIFQTLREKDDKESTGIGLAIIKKIIEDLHCTIRVSSELGKGAEFIFTWPKTNYIL